MSSFAREAANHAQRVAADPAVSAFVAASAGSGKTKLLTDRLLRLMLAGNDPARIQCLTFTKAAAAEMALRLQRTLGSWVTLDDDALDVRLRALDVAVTDAHRRNARKLFATVLDLPGGMRIGTIHAFCQSLLRRFPLEAQLSPHFRLMDDPDATVALAAAREAMLAEAHTAERRAALEQLAGLASLQEFGGLVERLRSDPARLAAAMRDGPAALEVRLRDRLGGRDPAEIAHALATECDAPALHVAIAALAGDAPPSGQALAEDLAGWLGCDSTTRADNLAAWRTLFFTGLGEPRKPGGLVKGKFLERRPDVLAILLAEQERLIGLEDAGRAWTIAGISAALASLAAPVAQAYAARKAAAGLLDYSDLIRASSALLVDPGAAWVLYKLDGGLDHLLLDEVQDTAPEQWEIAGKLTEEFFAGTGARDGPRTVFAVGDRKQSIYAFQGADPDGFELWRARLQDRVSRSGGQWRDVPLDVSFRSTEPVLALVDAVFAAPPASDGVAAPGTLRHLADRAGHAGLVELWPLAPVPEPPEVVPWTVPAHNQGSVSAMQRLAASLAGWIAGQTDGSVTLPSRGRPLAAGDVLVLVRRRNAFARALVGALKARQVPVAGLDRLVLTEQPAVADLLALCDTLLLPDDDLSLACVLTSPLGGLSDDSLMELAAARPASLWAALGQRGPERANWQAAHGFITTLLARVDYASPHAVLAEALGPLGGRARLLARLGSEAAEPVDELLNAALSYARAHPPSLQGFLHWLRQSGAEVKREATADGGGGGVRIMTVHGAKGLQAPLVILPDTTALPPDEGPVVWDDDLPVWSPRRELRCQASQALRAGAQARRMAEHNRLLYVALTRAEDRLVVCGWSPRKALPDASWYRLVQDGFARLPTRSGKLLGLPEPWEGDVLALETAQTVPPLVTRPDSTGRAATPVPAWAGQAPDWTAAPPPAEPALPTTLAPSRPEGRELGSVPQAASPLASRDATGQRFKKGQLVHLLLQYLPEIELHLREAAARRFLDRPGHGLDPGAVSGLVREVLAVLVHPDLAPLFGVSARAEVPLAGVVAGASGGGQVVGGLVDRLAVLDDCVMVADYKTNRAPPATPEAVPVMYLRQMAAYRAVLAGVFPGRAIKCALVWTVGPVVMALPDALLDRHAPTAPQAA